MMTGIITIKRNVYVVNHVIYGYKVAFLNGFSNVVLEHQVNHEQIS